ncbi:MAG TPA: hypothetical protein VIN40_07755 [Candidatus Tyrphobacter sp.]
MTILLCDSAQAVGGKLYVLGGGWSITGPQPAPMAVALKLSIPWSDANRRFNIKIALVDADGRPVRLPTTGADGEANVEVPFQFEAGRPAGLVPGTPLDGCFAVNFPPMPLAPGARYEWRVEVDGRCEEAWRVPFSVRAKGAGEFAPA